MRRIRTFADAWPRLLGASVLALLVTGISVLVGPGLSLGELFSQNPPAIAGIIVGELRLPRALVALWAGAALAGSGAVVQALLRNPLAGPEIMGISSGAAAGAVAVAFFGGVEWGTPLVGALAGAGLTALVVFGLASRSGSTSLTGILLAGMAVSSLLAGATTLMLVLRQENQLSQYLFWIVGSLQNKRWSDFELLGILGTLALVGMTALSGRLNLLSLGETTARSLGLRIQGLRLAALGLMVVATAASVAVCGSIGFLGLLVPHAVRLRWGQDFRWIVPLSALCGAAFLGACDLIVRVVFSPFEVPVGILTGVFGAPFFLFLLLRHQRHHRGAE